MSTRQRFPGTLRRCGAVGLLLTIACSTASTGPAGPNSLAITVDGLPSGTTPTIVVSGPGGYSHTLSGSATLTKLAPGNYSISALAASSANPIVSSRYTSTISVNPVQVSGTAAASARITYSARSGTGALWVVGGTNSNGNVLNWGTAYTASQLATSGTPRLCHSNDTRSRRDSGDLRQHVSAAIGRAILRMPDWSPDSTNRELLTARGAQNRYETW
jgi:hypothetical protein